MEIRLHQRLAGDERMELARSLAGDYTKGCSIRQLAAANGTSIGRVRNLLLEAGVELRPKGGARRQR